MDAAGNEIGPSDACKIRNFGNYTVVDSGIASYPWTGFNVWEYFASIKATSVADFSNQLKEQLPPKFQTAYTDLKKRTGKVIAVPGDIGVMAFEGGKPVFIWIFFFVQDETVKAAVHNDGRELDLNSGKASTIPIGEGNAMTFSDFAKLDCPFGDQIANIRCYLAAYIKTDPKHINAPIAILKLTSTAGDWIEKGVCKD
jgi:hypothetical protein